MRVRVLAVEGAIEFTPEIFPDQRGVFASPFQEAAFSEAAGGRLFPVAQSSVSTSRRDVVRGIHFTRTPPGMARYVCCPRGKALDIVVDLRVGSPSFGRWDSVVLDQESVRAVYLPMGVGHAFVALEDDTVMCYLLSQSYTPENEFSLSVYDPELDLPLPPGITPILSERDRQAPTLASAQAKGLLPEYAKSMEIERNLLANHPRTGSSW
jgi:epimerase EvaD